MITSNINKLDTFLGGGIKSGVITDIFGQNGTGKTQLVLQISINALQNGGRVLYQDSTGEFRPERMHEIILSRGIDRELLDNMIIGRITNVSEQKKYLKKIDDVKNCSLVIIDNVTDLFSFEYSKKKQLFEKHVTFMQYMHELSFIAIQKNIPIIVTNIVRNKNNEEVENLEKSISMFTHFKIKLSKNGTKYTGEVFPSFLNRQIFSYLITKQGLIDAS